MGLKLYGMNLSTNTIRTIAALNELGLEYEMEVVDLRTGAHKQPSFLALNPFGQIPVLQDGDLVIFDSRAINKYLACNYKEKSGCDLLLRDGTDAESAAVDVWLEVESQNYNPPISTLVTEALIKPMFGRATDAAVVEANAEKLAKVLDIYEFRLSKCKYIAGDKFSLADLNHIPYTYYLMKTPKKELVTSRPHVLAWFQDITSRTGWKRTAEGIKLPS